MGLEYTSVQWNRQKRIYDFVLAGGVGAFLILFAVLSKLLFPFVITYHAGGDTNPILSIFKGSPVTGSVAGVPFQPFGFLALVILVLMAATSHDFWLANLSAPVWKSLHMLVYAAYGLLVLHVTFGVLQAEVNPVYVVTVAAGLLLVLGLHITAAFKEAAADRELDGKSRREEAHSSESEMDQSL